MAPSRPLPVTFENRTTETKFSAVVPWFVAADICAALDHGNVTHALKRLADGEQALTSNEGIQRDSDQVDVVNEAGRYNLIFGRRKPAAGNDQSSSGHPDARMEIPAALDMAGLETGIAPGHLAIGHIQPFH